MFLPRTAFSPTASFLVDTTNTINHDPFPSQAELEGPVGTPYEGKYFVLKLVFGHEFPAAPPRGFFLTKMYHPNVDMSSGAICVNTLKKDWTVQTTLSHVLNVIRCLLIVPFPESSLNDEAGRLFMESYDEYSKRARLMADVHGRNVEVEPTSASASASATLPGTVENGSDEGISNGSSNSINTNNSSTSGRSRGVLKSSLDSTNNTTVTSVETGSSASTAKKQKGNNASGKLGKKKSLKRL
jgi:ubiquitin-conjugating enzyme E2 S